MTQIQKKYALERITKIIKGKKPKTKNVDDIEDRHKEEVREGVAKLKPFKDIIEMVENLGMGYSDDLGKVDFYVVNPKHEKDIKKEEKLNQRVAEMRIKAEEILTEMSDSIILGSDKEAQEALAKASKLSFEIK